MPTVIVDVETLHFEHQLWRTEIKFFEDELRIFERRLEELVQKVQENNVMAQLEHFQNQFIRQRDVLNELTHEIKVHDQMLALMLKGGHEPADPDLFQHTKVEDQLSTFRKIYQELKQEFSQFLAKHLYVHPD